MVWCSHCEDNCDTEQEYDQGYICCKVCGKVIEQDVFYNGPEFEKTRGGQTRLSGNIQNAASAYSLSRQKTLDKGRYEISTIVHDLNMAGGESTITRAHNLYTIAVERNFTKGRRLSHVAAACLYIDCRQSERAYLLIEFSDFLMISVYVLGAVFLQLCKLLRLSDHPIVQKLVDPSLFIHRFTERLLGRRDNLVSELALRIVASMKRDWMQTGRKPSGLCGAALYISALSHGLNYSKSEIVAVVHICEATLTKRLIEFENTESGSLTIDEFIARADELNEGFQSYQSPTPGQLICAHKDTNEPHYAHGLCRQCFNEFIKLSGGLVGGAEPPAFQHAEKQRIKKMKTEGKDMEQSDLPLKPTLDSTGYAAPATKDPSIDGRSSVYNSAFNDSEQDLHEEETRDPDLHEEETRDPDLHEEETRDPDNFSDIDDIEVDGYLHNEEEKKFKKIIWEKMNKEFLEEQAAKEAAVAAKEASYAALVNNSKEFLSAQELAAATAEALKNSKKEKRQKRAEERKNSAPAKSPLEATCQVLKRKSFSSKINYKAVENLYKDNAKKALDEINVSEADNGEKTFEEKHESVKDPTMDSGDDFEARANVGDPYESNYDDACDDFGNADDYYSYEDDYNAYGDSGNGENYYD